MFILAGVWKHFGSGAAPVLCGLDLAVETGRTTVLIGPSGCGKSTVLRLMLGLTGLTGGQDRGSVTFDGRPVTRSNVASIRRRVGYVIQAGGLFPHLTARENVTLMARHLRWDRGAIDGRLADLARRAQLPPETLGRYPGELSGGQRQRVALLRALMLDPDVLLLDEPLGALDPMIRYDLQQDLRRLFQELHKTVVLVTHDMGEAGFFGDSIVLLREGRVAQQGTLHELVHHPRDTFVERFITAQRGPLEVLEQANT